jgi:hypothetical protein
VGLAYTEDAAGTLPKYLDRARPAFPIGTVTPAAAAAFLGAEPGERLIPTLVVVDPRGVVRFQKDALTGHFSDPDQEEARTRAVFDALFSAPPK